MYYLGRIEELLRLAQTSVDRHTIAQKNANAKQVLMSELFNTALQETISLAILVLVLVGLFRIANRIMGIIEMGVERFLKDFERIADGIADIANRGKNG